LKILIKSSLVSWLEHDVLWNFNFLIKLFWYFRLGLKWQNWIDNQNPKSDFDFGLSIPILSTKLDCNPDWAIQQSNTAIPWLRAIIDQRKVWFEFTLLFWKYFWFRNSFYSLSLNSLDAKHVLWIWNSLN